jgi:hypothetical protein
MPEFRLHYEENAAWKRAIAEPRLAYDDMSSSGIGIRRLQLIRCPAFEEACAYEIRQGGAEWRLFSSQVVESPPQLMLVGYNHIPIDSKVLSSFFERVVSTSLPLAPFLDGSAGLDGTLFELAIFGDKLSEWRFKWWSVSPPQWSELVAIANEMLVCFASAEDICKIDSEPLPP